MSAGVRRRIVFISICVFGLTFHQAADAASSVHQIVNASTVSILMKGETGEGANKSTVTSEGTGFLVS
jgi:hypothetical protein